MPPPVPLLRSAPQPTLGSTCATAHLVPFWHPPASRSRTRALVATAAIAVAAGRLRGFWDLPFSPWFAPRPLGPVDSPRFPFGLRVELPCAASSGDSERVCLNLHCSPRLQVPLAKKRQRGVLPVPEPLLGGADLASPSLVPPLEPGRPETPTCFILHRSPFLQCPALKKGHTLSSSP